MDYGNVTGLQIGLCCLMLIYARLCILGTATVKEHKK
jgi:hypothetical protein